MPVPFTKERYLAEKYTNTRYCSGCKKDIQEPNKNFYLRPLALDTGEIVKVPRGKCIPCAKADARKRSAETYLPSTTPHAEAVRQSLSNRARSKGPEPGTLEHAAFCRWAPTQPERVKRYVRV